MSVISCEKCRRIIAKEDRRRKRLGSLFPVAGASVSVFPNSAPRVKCPGCGAVTVLLRGSL